MEGLHFVVEKNLLEPLAPAGRIGSHGHQEALVRVAPTGCHQVLIEIASYRIREAQIEDALAAVGVDHWSKRLAPGARTHFIETAVRLLFPVCDGYAFREPINLRESHRANQRLLLIFQRMPQLMQEELAMIELPLVKLRRDVNLRAGGECDGSLSACGHVWHQTAELCPGGAFDDCDALGSLELFELFGLRDKVVELAICLRQDGTGWPIDIRSLERQVFVARLPWGPREERPIREGKQELQHAAEEQSATKAFPQHSEKCNRTCGMLSSPGGRDKCNPHQPLRPALRPRCPSR